MHNSYSAVLRNNSGSKPKDMLIDEFVVRNKELDTLMSRITTAVIEIKPVNYLVIGQRGAGKTTLLHRVKYAIADNEIFNGVIPVLLDEEQYSVSDLTDFWVKIIEHCSDSFGWKSIYKQLSRKLDENSNELEIRSLITDKLMTNEKRMLVFVENINVFFKKIGKEQSSLLNFVSSSPLINLIGSSTSITDLHIDLADPAYEFFNRLELKGLSTSDCIKLLLKISENNGYEERIREIITHHKSRVESLRRLTGGVPRTISYLFQIFLDNESGRAMLDLYQLVDTLSMMYKAEIDQLSPQQQKVIDAIAKNWDAVGVKDIAKVTRLESKNISSILSTLEKNSLVEKVYTKTKNNLYRIRERFLNIWYLMRFGRKAERENVKWLVRFFDIWCDESELAKRVVDYLAELQGGGYDPSAAVDMGNTFLSCRNIPAAMKYMLYNEVKNILPEKLSKNVRVANSVLYSQMTDLMEKGKLDKARKILDEIEIKDGQYYIQKTWLEVENSEYENALNSAKKIVELDPNNPVAEVMLGGIYEDFLHDDENARIHFTKGHELNHPYATYKLGEFAYKIDGDVKSAITYYKKAMRKFTPAYSSLIMLYTNEQEYALAESVAQSAIKAKAPEAYVLLGRVYATQGRFENAEEAFKTGFDNGEWIAAIYLGMLYLEKQSTLSENEIEDYLQKSIEKNVERGNQVLGKFYRESQNNEELAELTWKAGVEQGDRYSAHELAHFYSDNNDFDAAEEMFFKSAELGQQKALVCYVIDVYKNMRLERKQKALEVVRNNTEIFKDGGAVELLVGARILLWNEEVAESMEFFKSTYEIIKDIVVAEKESDARENFLNEILHGITTYLLLLLAQERYDLCRSLFEDKESSIDLKSVIKPIYYVLMETLKNEFPYEYLKAGPELADAIEELQKSVQKLKSQL